MAVRRVTWRQRIVLLLLSVLAVATALEIGVRGYDSLTGRGFLSGHRNLLAQEPRPRRPFRQFGADHYLEQDGKTFLSSTHGELYPLEKPEGTLRIVVFGGSTTQNQDSFERAGTHYPLVLQRILRERTGRADIEVINVGSSGYSTAHMLVLLALDVLSWDADLVILSENMNDLSAAYWPDFRLDYSNKYAHESYLGPDWKERFTLSNVLLQHSQAYWFLVQAWRDARLHFVDPDRLHGIQRRSQGPLPDPRASAVFERNLRSFVTLAASHGIQPVLGTQALHTSLGRFTDHMMAKSYNDVVVYPTHEESILHHAHYNGILARVAAETGAWFVDNDATMHAVDAYFIDHVHYTPEGVDVLAGNYASVLLEHVADWP